MTDIVRYEDLVFAVGEYIDRDDLVDLMPRFVGLAELRLNRDLRADQQTVSTTISIVNGEATLPADCLEIRSLYQVNYRPLRAMAEEELADFTDGGVPVGFVVRAGVLRVVPASTITMIIVYSRKVPALTAASPTNWLLTAAPDLYLWSACAEAATYIKNVELGSIANQRYSDAMTQYRTADNAYRWSRARVMPQGVNP